MKHKSNNPLSRRVEKILPSEKGLLDLIKSKKIRLYLGIDPTGSKLQLGHTIGLRKLMEFANLGHQAILLFGTGTVLVGDPSQRDSARKLITQEEIDANIKNWQDQVKPIVDFSKVKIMQNGDWLTKLTLKEIIKIASNISAVQLFKRDMFQRRLESGDTVWYHETMYPLLQGYDSVVMDVDLEIGGTDQEFNMLIGRELQKKINNKEKYILTTPMIMGTDNKPMSKSSGNCIWLSDTPQDMYGKLMSISDQQIRPYFELLTDIPLEEIDSLPDNPLQNKKRLALDITTQFHGKALALKAKKYFETAFQKRMVPEKAETFPIKKGSYPLIEILKQANLDISNSQIKRTITQGGVEVNNKKITDPNQNIDIKGGEIFKFGKRTFRKASLTN